MLTNSLCRASAARVAGTVSAARQVAWAAVPSAAASATTATDRVSVDPMPCRPVPDRPSPCRATVHTGQSSAGREMSRQDR